MLLDCIIWPSSITTIFERYEEQDLDEDESCFTDVCRVSSYLKAFIENGKCKYGCGVFEVYFSLSCVV